MLGPVGERIKIPPQFPWEQHGDRKRTHAQGCVRGDSFSQCPKRHVPFVCLGGLAGGKGGKRWLRVGSFFSLNVKKSWIDATESGWRLDFKENQMGKGLRVARGWELGVGIREGTRLVWMGGSTWLNTRASWQRVQSRPKDPPPQLEQAWGGGRGALAGRLPAACLPV